MKENDKDKQNNKGSNDNSKMNTQEFDVNSYLDRYSEPTEKKSNQTVNKSNNVNSNSKSANAKNPNSKPAKSKNDSKKNAKKPSNKDPNMVDISSYSKKPKHSNKFTDFWTQKGHTGRKVSAVVLIVLVVCLATFFALFYSKLDMIKANGGGKEKYTGQDKIVNDIDYAQMNGVTNTKDLFGMLKEWANNGGEKMSSGNVVNIMLVGVDSASKLSDTMMLMSIDKKDKKINLVSFYRDSLTYIKTPKGKETYAKMNASYSYGGADLVVKTLENNYKIKIDDYALVDYNSFPKVINALGGVTVDVKSNEAKYMNVNYGFGMSAGVQKLNGERALKYCRIRHCDADSDVSRTRRQRGVITSIMSSFKTASISQMNNAINALFPNIETSMSKSAIVGYGSKAITNGWLDFTMNQADMPSNDTRKGASMNPLGDVIIADYPGAAYKLQNLLYGKSNIKLSSNRISAINLKPAATTSKYTTTKAYSYSSKAEENTTTTTKSYTTTTTAPSQTTTTTAPSQTTTTTKPITPASTTPPGP